MKKLIQDIVKLKIQSDDFSTEISYEDRKLLEEKMVKMYPWKQLNFPKPQEVVTPFGTWHIVVEPKNEEKTMLKEKGYVETTIEILDKECNLKVSKLTVIHICDKVWKEMNFDNNDLFPLFHNNDAKLKKLLLEIKYNPNINEEIAKKKICEALNIGKYSYSSTTYIDVSLDFLLYELEERANSQNYKDDLYRSKNHWVGKPIMDYFSVEKNIGKHSLINQDLSQEEIEKNFKKIQEKYENIPLDEYLKHACSLTLEKAKEYTRLNNYNLYIAKSIGMGPECDIIKEMFLKTPTLKIEQYKNTKDNEIESRKYIETKITVQPKLKNKIKP